MKSAFVVSWFGFRSASLHRYGGLLIATLLTYAAPCPAAWMPEFVWSTGGGSSLGAAEGLATATDPAGNTVIAGYFSGTARFGEATIVNAGGSDFFIAKYDPDGQLAWVRTGGGLGEARAQAVALDTTGDVVVAGYFQGAIQVAGIPVPNSGLEEAFTAKYTPQGDLTWIRTFGGSGLDRAAAVATGPAGEVVVTGFYNDTAAFGGTNLTSNGTNEVFVLNYDADGNPVWARSAGGTLRDEGRGIGVDRFGNVLVGGFFNGVAYFGTNRLEVMSAINGTTDLFLMKYAPDGRLLWVRRAGGGSSEDVKGLALDPAGNALITGRFFYTAWFGDLSVTSTGGGYPEDCYVAKYSPEGDPLWVRSGGGTGIDTGTSIAADEGGNVFVGGRFAGSASFSGKPLTSKGGDDLFLVSYSAAGTLHWATNAGGPGPDTAAGLATDSAGHMFATGTFGSPNALFGDTPLLTGTTQDFFFSKLVAFDPASGPIITEQPADRTIVEGTNTVFAAGFTGMDVHFQWLLDGAPLPFGTNSCLVLTNVMASQAGGYSLVLTNIHGGATSTVATLTVSLVPMITVPPVGRVAALGTNVSLAVEAVSSTPMRYQWLLDGHPVQGATNATLSMTNMQYAQFGGYAAVVSNSFGAVTSATALVTADLMPEVLWTLRLGNTQDDQGIATAVTGTNVYLASLFTGTLQFGPSNVVSAGGTDILLNRYDQNGRLLWVRRAGGTMTETPRSVAVDPSGNILVAGAFQSPAATFEGLTLTNANVSTFDLFLAKYTPSGGVVWARRAGLIGSDQGSAVATDSAGNVYLTGYYYDTILFDGIGLTNRNYTNFFLAKFDPNGSVQWARTAISSNTCLGNGLTVDAATNIYVTGTFFGTADFGAGVLTSSNSSFFNGNVFVAKYDPDGTLQWARKGPASGIGTGKGLATDAAGNLYASSYKRDYGTGYLLSRYTGDGSLIWYRTNAISCCTGDATYPNGMAVEPDGDTVLAGWGNGSIQNLPSLSSGGYLLKYRSDGEGYWVQRCGTEGNSVARDDLGNLYVAGRFTGTSYFGGSSNLVSAGGNDIFLVKFGVRPPAIVNAPNKQIVAVGSAVYLSATANGSGPLAYQWQFNGINIPFATGSTLTLANFQPDQVGNYSVVVQNTSGSVTSRVATVAFVPTLNYSFSGEDLTLTWPGSFTLQTSTNADGPYMDIPEAGSGYTHPVDPADPKRYFRLRLRLLP